MSDHIMIGNAKVLIDPEDYERVNGYSWHIHTGRGTVRVKKKGMNTSMQKFILNITDKDMTAYHVNGNPWDNRKDNYGNAPSVRPPPMCGNSTRFVSLRSMPRSGSSRRKYLFCK